MFSKNTKPSTGNSITTTKQGVPSIISQGLNVLGNMISDGSVEIEGRIDGNLTCSHATIHRTGFIKGDIVAETVTVNGEIRGLIKARHVRLSENAKVIGVVMYEHLSIADGAFIDGQCKNTDKLQRNDIGITITRQEQGADANEGEDGDADSAAELHVVSERAAS